MIQGVSKPATKKKKKKTTKKSSTASDVNTTTPLPSDTNTVIPST
jgi:hypothetical protein